MRQPIAALKIAALKIAALKIAALRIGALRVALLTGALLAGALSGCAAEQDAPPCAGKGVICTFMGDGRAAIGKDGLGPKAVSLYLPQDLTWGPDGRAYVMDWNNHRVRVVDGDVVRTLVGTGELGDAPDGPALQTRLNHPTHVSFAPNGHLILSAWHNSKVMQLDLGSGQISAICGTGARSYDGEGGPAAKAVVDLPVGTAFDAQGRMYIMDQGNQRIRRVEADGNLNTVVGPVGPYLPEGYIEICVPPEEEFQAPTCRFCLKEEAADPECTGPPARPQGFAGEAAAGGTAYMNQPFSQSAPPSGGMEMGADGVLYFTDTGNHLVRALYADGTVATVAGVAPPTYDATQLPGAAPKGGYSGDGGPALQARFNNPRDVAVAADGALYVADRENSCVRKIDTEGVISTAAGTCGSRGDSGDGGPATAARLNRPYGVALDAAGKLYIADTYNHRIRVVDLAPDP